MGLAEQQRCLARLYTDRAFRQGFFADPRGTAEAEGLPPREARQLAALSPREVGLFARSLRHKRCNEAAKLLPRTRGVLGLRFGQLFARFADGKNPGGMRKYREEALAFAAFLAQEARHGRLEPAWVGDLVRYEGAWLQMTDPTVWCMARWFRYPVGVLAGTVARGEISSGARPQRTMALWFRPGRAGRLRHVVFPVWPLRAGRLWLPSSILSSQPPPPPDGHLLSDR